MAADILIDTSIWIDFFRNKLLPSSERLIRLLDRDRALITGIVLTELIRGVRNDSEWKRLRELLKPVPTISPNEETWEKAGTLAYKLSRKGLTVFTVDVVIATIAIENSVSLFSTDRHFQQIAAHSDLKLWV